MGPHIGSTWAASPPPHLHLLQVEREKPAQDVLDGGGVCFVLVLETHYKCDLRSFKSTTEYKEKNFLTLPLPSCTPRRQPKLLISRVSFRNLSLPAT